MRKIVNTSEGTGGQRKLHNEELRCLHSSPNNIISVNKSRGCDAWDMQDA
jgi:hypothetical protein